MNKEKSYRAILILSLACFIITGCESAPTRNLTPEGAYLIDSKAQIRNQDETNNVKIQIAVWPQRAIRLEITAALGVSVASVLFRPNEIIYALHAQKQYVRGPFHEKTLYPIFKKNIDPRIFWRVASNQNLTNLNFKCSFNAESKPMLCESIDGVQIKWTYEASPRKRIDIISNRFEMNWLFKDQNPLSESQNETFVLKKPASYQEIIIK